ncbi:hypothetical protein SUGI_1161210 [Cryptomeria japonica]|nr:hypothetical protein SUGI_1161210 [Cryptomeria japonica]
MIGCHWSMDRIGLSAFISHTSPLVRVSSGKFVDQHHSSNICWVSWLLILSRIPPQPDRVWQFLLLFSNPDL